VSPPQRDGDVPIDHDTFTIDESLRSGVWRHWIRWQVTIALS
jgi:hypothetical protein